jgi:hypothetical protein
MIRRLSPLFVSCVLFACGGVTPNPDSGVDPGDGGFFRPFAAPSASSVNNSFLVTLTGEASAIEGVGFPPPTGGGEAFFIDGWEVKYEHVLVTVGAVTLADGPDTNPNDQSVTGAVVAEAVGPWAVDLAKEGALASKEQNGKAVALARLTNQNKKTGTPAFDPTSKYAFTYSLVTASEGAQNVNLDAAGETAYRAMADAGYSVLLVGTATWKGDQGTPACRSTNVAYDFGRFPKAVKFSFGFKAPVTYTNCINPELSPADSRGVQSATNTQTVSQLTFHLDHPFWEALVEDAPLRWDALAARKSVMTGAGPMTAELTTADLAFDFLAPRDAQNAPIPWRTCGPVEAGERTTGTVSYDPATVPTSPQGGAAGLANLLDYMTYNLSSFGHLNNDGLCFPDRKYPSPQ